MIKQDSRYTETHEWAKKDGDVITTGLSAHAVEQLGDIVFVELPEEGAELVKGESLGTIESVKAASDIYAPVSGKVLEVNTAATENYDLFKEDPYEKAWLLKVQFYDEEEYEALMDAKQYENFINEE